MLSLTKKSDAQPVAAPLWHTNFRNFDRLPDTKVVRTAFFVNTGAGALAIALLLWLGYREYRIHSIGEQITDAQREIDSNAKKNADALRLTTTAEGVETASQAMTLTAEGCENLQGFLFARPMPLDALRDWLAADRQDVAAA